MSAHAYTEDQLVEQPAIGLFAELGWTTVSAMEEVFGPSGTLGRETSGEVVLAPRLRAALEKLNPKLPPRGISIQGASTIHKATRPNYNESFFISHDRGADHPDVVAGVPLRGRNQWPEGHERIRTAMMTYFKTLEGVGERMLPVLARALGMPAEHFAPFFANEAHINLRFLHYPPQDIADDEQFGQGPHTDNSFITILARTEVPGLAVRLPGGEWLAPPLIPGTFLVNLGNKIGRAHV